MRNYAITSLVSPASPGVSPAAFMPYDGQFACLSLLGIPANSIALAFPSTPLI